MAGVHRKNTTYTTLLSVGLSHLSLVGFALRRHEEFCLKAMCDGVAMYA